VADLIRLTQRSLLIGLVIILISGRVVSPVAGSSQNGLNPAQPDDVGINRGSVSFQLYGDGDTIWMSLASEGPQEFVDREKVNEEGEKVHQFLLEPKVDQDLIFGGVGTVRLRISAVTGQASTIHTRLFVNGEMVASESTAVILLPANPQDLEANLDLPVGTIVAAGSTMMFEVAYDEVLIDTFEIDLADSGLVIAMEVVSQSADDKGGFSVFWFLPLLFAAIFVASEILLRPGQIALARFTSRRVIENETVLSSSKQGKILARVEERPGVELSNLRAEMGLSRYMLLFHLEVLLASGRLHQVRSGRIHRFAPKNVDLPVEDLLDQQQTDIFARIRQKSISRSELAEDLSLSKQRLHLNLKRLERLGLIKGKRQRDKWMLSAL